MWQMPGDFLGDLSKRRLFDLIKPLVDAKKSGQVIIEGTNKAGLYLDEGSFIHGETALSAGEEAILAIMDLEDGPVFFDSQAVAGKRTVNTVTEQLMSNWAQREEEWGRIRKVVPSFDAVFAIAVDSGGHKRVIQERHWGVLALCNGIRSVSDIAAELGRRLFDVSKAICEMVGAGVIEKTRTVEVENAHPRETVEESFFVLLQTELTKVMGPIARVIINDTLTAFEESREAFPKDRVGSFVRTVSDQIAEEQKREQFGKAIYAFLMDSRTW
jgi:hypothetical protein